jgi:hypothetical protein
MDGKLRTQVWEGKADLHSVLLEVSVMIFQGATSIFTRATNS